MPKLNIRKNRSLLEAYFAFVLDSKHLLEKYLQKLFVIQGPPCRCPRRERTLNKNQVIRLRGRQFTLGLRFYNFLQKITPKVRKLFRYEHDSIYYDFFVCFFVV